MPGSPSWLTEACPAWCEYEHSELDHPQDRLHERGAFVPGVRRDGEAACLQVSIERRVGTRETWVSVDDEKATLTMSVESAERLRDLLIEQLDALN